MTPPPGLAHEELILWEANITSRSRLAALGNPSSCGFVISESAEPEKERGGSIVCIPKYDNKRPEERSVGRSVRRPVEDLYPGGRQQEAQCYRGERSYI